MMQQIIGHTNLWGLKWMLNRIQIYNAIIKLEKEMKNKKDKNET